MISFLSLALHVALFWGRGNIRRVGVLREGCSTKQQAEEHGATDWGIAIALFCVRPHWGPPEENNPDALPRYYCLTLEQAGLPRISHSGDIHGAKPFSSSGQGLYSNKPWRYAD